MKAFVIITSSIILSLLSFTPAQPEVYIRPYYFPYKDFFSPKVYLYENIGTKTRPEQRIYWRMWTQVEGKDTIFYTSTIDDNFQAIDTMIEKITPNGSVLIGYSFFGQRAIISKKDVFKWKQALNSSIVFNYQSPSDGKKIKFSKQRTFIAKDVKAKYNFKTFEAIDFTDLFKTIYPLSDEKESVMTRKSTYARGIGLVTFVNLEDNNRFELKRIYTEKEWGNR